MPSLLRECPECGGDWPVSHYGWWSGKCRACRAFGVVLARVFNEAYWRFANQWRGASEGNE